MNEQNSTVSNEPRDPNFWWYIPVGITMMLAGILAVNDMVQGRDTASTYACLIFMGTVTWWIASTAKPERCASNPSSASGEPVSGPGADGRAES